MGVERTIGIRCVHKPFALASWCYDIDDAADGIGSEPYRHDSAVNLYAVGKVDRDIIEPERASYAFLRHTVDKHFDMLAAEAVHCHSHVRPYASALAYLHARSLGQGFAESLGGVGEFTGIDGCCIES